MSIPSLIIRGQKVSPDALLACEPGQLAMMLDMPVALFYAYVERWASGPALPWGFEVDRAAGRITRSLGATR